MKVCSKCKTSQDESNFYKRPINKLYAECKSCTKTRVRNRSLNNPVAKSLSNRRYRRKCKRGLLNFYAAQRRALKMQATPIWLSEKHKEEIKNVYLVARELSRKSRHPYEVDHIIPLRGINVSGLHVPWNLQIITRSQNRSKKNFV